MNLLLVISCVILIILSVYGYKKGLVRALLPIISGLLWLVFLYLLRDWLFSFLFQWTFFQGEHILARVVVILLFYFAGVFALKWVLGMLNFITKLPLIHGVNKLAGAAVGLMEGFLAVWLLLYIIQTGNGILFGIDFMPMISENRFLDFLFQHNLIGHLMTTLFGGWIGL